MNRERELLAVLLRVTRDFADDHLRCLDDACTCQRCDPDEEDADRYQNLAISVRFWADQMAACLDLEMIETGIDDGDEADVATRLRALATVAESVEEQYGQEHEEDGDAEEADERESAPVPAKG
ncbi:MAG: hypothetical protein U0871_01455 [Gemmataceae bacterium]